MGKKKDLAVYFKSKVNVKKIWIALILYTALFCTLTFYLFNNVAFLIFISMVLFVFIYRKWTMKNFGGMTGDLLGALCEGMEVFLWGMVLLFI